MGWTEHTLKYYAETIPTSNKFGKLFNAASFLRDKKDSGLQNCAVYALQRLEEEGNYAVKNLTFTISDHIIFTTEEIMFLCAL